MPRRPLRRWEREHPGVARRAKEETGPPRLLVTGFGSFPGAPDNPTEVLVHTLAEEPPETFGASALKAVVLPTEYRRSWAKLRRLHSSFAPDVAVHFGLSARAVAIQVEGVGRNRVNPRSPDACGYAPASERLVRGGADILASTFPVQAILSALTEGGVPAALSEDAGDYVCNATLYRALRTAPPTRRVGFIHVPSAQTIPAERLLKAARTILRVTVAAHSDR